MSKLLHISNLSVGYKKELLTNFNLQVEAGEMCAIIGRNGVGKTTLLKTIAGLVKKISGEIFIEGKNIDLLNASERARLVSIVLTQKIALQGIDVKTLVAMGRYPLQGRFHFSNEKDDEMVLEQLQKLNMLHLADKRLSEISDGEMQKAMIARTLAQQTPLLVMDEPTAFLDYVAKEELFETLAQLPRDNRIGIVFSSHDLELVHKHATSIVEV